LDERPQYPDLGYSRRTNICDLQTALAGLDADVIGFAEITDGRRFPPVLRRSGGDRRFKLAQSRHGGRRAQRLAIAWDADVLEMVGQPIEIREVALTQGLRPGFAVGLRRLDDAFQFTAIQLHLKSRREGYSTRMEQHAELVEWIDRFTAETGARPIVVMGDFNTVGSDRNAPWQEIEEVDEIYAEIGCARVPNSTGCTEYWEGGGPADGIQKASLLDLVYLCGFEGAVPQARSWLHCARADCEDLVSRPGEEDGTFWDVSDHCPVTVDLPPGPVGSL
jgi:endonuclease/exonuclease/phosphatase family metal-dependent hydrolase